MLPENITAVVTRNERWKGEATSEPFEAGWAREVVIFVRALEEPVGEQPIAAIEISPDGMHWIAEGSEMQMPTRKDDLGAARIRNFGNWLRVKAQFEDGATSKVLVTIHAKA